MKNKKPLKYVSYITVVMLLCTAFMFSMSACGDKESQASNDTVAKTSSSDTVSNASTTSVSTAKAESTSVDQKSDSPVSKMDDVAFKTKDGKTVKYGMKKADIDKVLGPGKGDNAITYGQLTVQYLEDVTSNMGISKDNATDESQFTVKGIKIGDKKPDVLKAMGTAPESIETGTSSTIQYYFKVDGENLQKLNSYKDIKDGGKYLAVTFAFAISSNDGVTDDSPVAMITEVSITPEMVKQLEQLKQQ